MYTIRLRSAGKGLIRQNCLWILQMEEVFPYLQNALVLQMQPILLWRELSPSEEKQCRSDIPSARQASIFTPICSMPAVSVVSNGQSGQGIYTDVIALMASGRIDMRKMVTGRVHLEDIEEGLAQAANRVSGKVLVSMDYPRL